MTEYRKGDVCSLATTFDSITEDGAARLSYTGPDGKFYAAYADPKLVTLLRRAPVDLATCDLPVGVVWSCGGAPEARGSLEYRGKTRGFVILDNGNEISAHLPHLRPLDAPAPESEVDLAAKIDRKYQDAIDEINGTKRPAPACGVREAIARDHATPSETPPGHIMIGGIAVPEPMREAPEIGTRYWLADPAVSDLCAEYAWLGSWCDQYRLSRGLCHLTREAAETHARALIAASGGVSHA